MESKILLKADQKIFVNLNSSRYEKLITKIIIFYSVLIFFFGFFV